jgi:hypothetical protein
MFMYPCTPSSLSPLTFKYSMPTGLQFQVAPIEILSYGKCNKVFDVNRQAYVNLNLNKSSLKHFPTPFGTNGILCNRTKSSVLSFVSIFAVLSIVVELLLANKTIMQRDIYYMFKHLFQNKNNANKAISDLCAILGVARHCLGIYSHPKGLFIGDLSYQETLSLITSPSLAPSLNINAAPIIHSSI